MWCSVHSYNTNSFLPSDFDVVYLQLMLLVWHSFPATVRADLLIQCVHIVIKVASTRE